jgi:O-antigen/teichoic acid export membrane protein
MPFDPIFGPVAAELEGRGDRRELRNQWVVTTRWIIMVTLPCFVLFFLLPDAVMALYGNAFTAGASVLMLLAAGRLANTLIGPGQMVLLVTNHAWLDLFNQTIAVALQVTLLYVLIPPMGILGAGIATASGLWLLNTLRLGETLRLLHMHPYAPSLLKPLAAFLCSGVVLMGFRMLYQTPDLIQFTLGIVLVLAVSGSVYWMAGFDPVDIDTFKNLWRKRLPPVSSEE